MFQKITRILTGSPIPPESSAIHPHVSSSDTDVSAALTTDQQILECWSAAELNGRRIEVFRPGPGHSTPPTTAILFLHGHGQVMLRNNLIWSRLFHAHNVAVVCPDGKRSWWLDVPCHDFDLTLTPQQWLLSEVVPFIERETGIQPPQIALLGVSMGGQGVLQLAYRHATRFPVVAAISPAVDFYQLYGSGLPLDQMFSDVEAARQASVVLNLHPLAWPRYQFFCCDPTDTEWFDGCARLGMKLSSSGILHERDLETSHSGHSWEYFNHMADKVMNHILKAQQSMG